MKEKLNTTQFKVKAIIIFGYILIFVTACYWMPHAIEQSIQEQNYRFESAYRAGWGTEESVVMMTIATVILRTLFILVVYSTFVYIVHNLYSLKHGTSPIIGLERFNKISKCIFYGITVLIISSYVETCILNFCALYFSSSNFYGVGEKTLAFTLGYILYTIQYLFYWFVLFLIYVTVKRIAKTTYKRKQSVLDVSTECESTPGIG